MANVAYYRVSTADQSVEMQRNALGGKMDREFIDEDVSGSVVTTSRPGFAALIEWIRDGDTLHLYALDRLGRDALDVQATVRMLLKKGVRLEVRGIGPIAAGVGEIVVAVLAQMADLERQRILDRCNSGREAARASLAATGKTHRGKTSLGRPMANNPADVVRWRAENGASISATCKQFGIGKTTLLRYMAAA